MTPIMGTQRVRDGAHTPSMCPLVCSAALSLCGILSPNCQAYTPDSPEVQRLLAPAMAFLENTQKSGQSDTLGGECLLGLAAHKYNRRFGQQPHALPVLTQQGLRRALTDASDLSRADVYSLGIALVFLSELQQLEVMDLYLQELLRRQKPHGGWGYPAKPTGDLSQIQYAVLGLWAAQTAKLDVPPQSMVDVMYYIIRVQDPRGAWGYQGIDPGSLARVPQEEVRPSLCAAGLGSLYVGADFLGMSKAGKPRNVAQKRLPPALVPVVEREDRAGVRRGDPGVDADLLRRAMMDGQHWFREFQPSLRSPTYQYYFLYAMERYYTYREKVEGAYEEEPRWYDEGVRLLHELQTPTGCWGLGKDGTFPPMTTMPPIATSFAMLFLLRSTRDTIDSLVDRDGVLRGGYGLPGDLTEVRLRNNRLVAPAITGEVEDLISMLEDEEGEKMESMLEHPEVLSLSGLESKGREYGERLTRILRASQSYQARRVAARALGRQGELDHVPILIFALSDPDPRVVREAHHALGLISCRFDGSDFPNGSTAAEVESCINRWKDWYRSVRPDAAFVE